MAWNKVDALNLNKFVSDEADTRGLISMAAMQTAIDKIFDKEDEQVEEKDSNGNNFGNSDISNSYLYDTALSRCAEEEQRSIKYTEQQFKVIDSLDQEIVLTKDISTYGKMKAVMENQENCDITIRIGNNEFKCHLILLKMYSKYFSDIKPNVVIKLPSNRVSVTAFATLYKWMEADKPSLERQGIARLYQAAQYLDIEDLCNHIKHYADHEIFKEDTAYELFMEALQVGAKKLSDLMIHRISKFFRILVASSEYLQLEVEQVCKFLNSNIIAVTCEEEVFLSAIRWVEHNWPTRKQHLSRIMSCIRFLSMPGSYLVNIKLMSEELKWITDCPEVEEMLSVAVQYNALKANYEDNNLSLMALMKKNKIVIPNPRRKLCIQCSIGANLSQDSVESYSDYIKYLQFIVDFHGDYMETLKCVGEPGCKCY